MRGNLGERAAHTTSGFLLRTCGHLLRCNSCPWEVYHQRQVRHLRLHTTSRITNNDNTTILMRHRQRLRVYRHLKPMSLSKGENVLITQCRDDTGVQGRNEGSREWFWPLVGFPISPSPRMREDSGYELAHDNLSLKLLVWRNLTTERQEGIGKVRKVKLLNRTVIVA
jgi:hypothetical protein